MQVVPPPAAAPPTGGKGAPGKGAPPPPPPPEEPAAVPPPQTHWSISYSSEFADVHGDPTAPEVLGGGVESVAEALESKPPFDLNFNYNFLRQFRTDTTAEALEQLINSTIRLNLHESSSGSILASMKLDLMPFAAKGIQKFDLEDVQLEPVVPAVEGGPRVSMRDMMFRFYIYMCYLLI